jgi:hypothetical protein
LSHHPRLRALPGALAGVLVSLLVCAPLSAQESSGFSLVGGLSWETGGPGPGLVDGLAAAGLDQTKPGRCTGVVCLEDVEHPYYFREGLGVVGRLGFRYRFDRPVSVDVVVAQGPRGHAKGYNDLDKNAVVMSYTTYVLTTTGGVHLGPLRVDAGPAVSRTTMEGTRNSVDTGAENTITVGAALGVEGSFPVSGGLVSLRTGLRYFPATELVNTVNVPARAEYTSLQVGVTLVLQSQ